MPTYKLRRFTRPGFLRRVQPSILLRFLGSFQGFFDNHKNIVLNSTEADKQLDYKELARVLASSPEKLPPDLAEALYMIEETSSTHSIPQLIREAEGKSIQIEEDWTPADLATMLWIHEPNAFERAHAEACIDRRRSFESFGVSPVDGPCAAWKEPTESQLRSLEKHLDQWFEKHYRGRGSSVLYFPREQDVAFVIRRGDFFRREGSLVDGRSSSVLYRPAIIDVILYSPELNELRINTKTQSVVDTYRREFGRHFFSDEEYFSTSVRYTLEPLRDLSSDVLVCSDFDNLEKINLVRLSFKWPGDLGQNIYEGDDVIRLLRHQIDEVPSYVILDGAKFSVRFLERKWSRVLVVRPPSTIQFTRGDDSFDIELWLRKRGFVYYHPIQRKSHAA